MELTKLLGRKYGTEILEKLEESDSERFNNLLEQLDCPSPKSLSDLLKEFIKQGMVEKQTFSEVPPRTEYSITDKGSDVLELVNEINELGEK